MAVPNWLARALARAKVVTVQVLTYDAATTYFLTRNGKSVSTIAAGSVNATATALTAAWNAATAPEFAAITATSATDTVTLTGDTAGVPFTVTSSKSGGAGTIGAATTTIAATGPNHWDDANNWDTGVVPANGDTANVNLDLGSVLYGTNQSGVTLANLNIFSAGFTQNTIGLPKINPAGYTEDEERFLKIGATNCKIDCGSSLVNLNFGSVQNATDCRRIGQSFTGAPALDLQGTNINNTFDNSEGSVGLAYYDGETYVASATRCGPAGSMVGGTGADVATIESLGNTIWSGPLGDFICAGGVSDIRGAQTTGTIEGQPGGRVILRFSGTVDEMTVGCPFDASPDRSPRTSTNTTIEAGGDIYDPNQTITYANKIERGLMVTRLTAA